MAYVVRATLNAVRPPVMPPGGPHKRIIDLAGTVIILSL
jgi:hypothetical protein